jgi:hypothetical protein
MRNLILFLLISITLSSCETTKVDYTKSELNSISFYDFNEKAISIENITKEWNKRINQAEKINAQIKNLKIITIIDKETNKSSLALLGNTNRNSVKTATKLIKFKNGLKLSEIVASCKNCNSKELNLGLNAGNWICINDIENDNDDCTKIVTMRTE